MLESLKNKLSSLIRKIPKISLKKSDTRKEKVKRAPVNANPASFSEVLSSNPILAFGLDLPFIIVSAINLRSAVALSIEMLFIHVVTMICAYFIASKVAVWQRVFVTSIVSVIMMLISRALVLTLIPDIENFVGIYLYLISVNAVTLIQANFLSSNSKLRTVVKNAFFNVLAFAVCMSLVSIIREFLGNGTIWGIPISPFGKLSGIQAPFFGFIIVGFMIAFIKLINYKITDESEIVVQDKFYLEVELDVNLDADENIEPSAKNEDNLTEKVLIETPEELDSAEISVIIENKKTDHNPEEETGIGINPIDPDDEEAN